MNIRKYSSVKLFELKGVPVFMHWTLYPVVLLAFIALFSDWSFVLGAVCFWGVMLVHELGHMWLAKRKRLQVLEIQLCLLHGYCVHEMSEFAFENYVVAWGGVLLQVFVAIPCVLVVWFAGELLPWYLFTPLILFGPVSLLIGVISLAPSKGLDGAVCWKAVPLYFRFRKSSKKKKQMRVVK